MDFGEVYIPAPNNILLVDWGNGMIGGFRARTLEQIFNLPRREFEHSYWNDSRLDTEWISPGILYELLRERGLPPAK